MSASLEHRFHFFRSVIMFIVEDVSFNICDQKFHEFEIRRQNPDVFVIRYVYGFVCGFTKAEQKNL